NTINIPTDLTLAEIAAIRAAVDVPLDVYVECPDNLGGIVRYHELSALVRVAAPVYLKFGLRGTVDPYPAGSHVAESLDGYARERDRDAEQHQRQRPERGRQGREDLGQPQRRWWRGQLT